jgi:hypothetical protein
MQTAPQMHATFPPCKSLHLQRHMGMPYEFCCTFRAGYDVS